MAKMSTIHLLVCGVKDSFAKSDNGMKTPDEDSLDVLCGIHSVTGTDERHF